MQTREFLKQDWYGYAGASGWSDGSLPLLATGTLANGDAYDLVLDATGGCLMIDNDEHLENGGYILDLPFPSQAAAAAFARGLGEPAHKLDFFLLGFQPA